MASYKKMAFPSEEAFRFLTQSDQWSAEPVGRLASYCLWEIMCPKNAVYAEDDENWLLELIGYEPSPRAKKYLLLAMNDRLEEAQAKRIYIPAADFFERLIHTAERQTHSLMTARIIGVGLDVMLRGSKLYKPFFDWAAQRIADDTLDDKTGLCKISLYKDHCPDGERLSIHANTAGKMAELVDKYPHMISSAYTEMCAMLVSVPMVGQPIITKWNEQPHHKTERFRITKKKKNLVAAIEKANKHGCAGLKMTTIGIGVGSVTADVPDLFPDRMLQIIDLAWRPVAAPNSLNLQVPPLNLQKLPSLVDAIRGHLKTACARPVSTTFDRGYPVVPYAGLKDPS